MHWAVEGGRGAYPVAAAKQGANTGYSACCMLLLSYCMGLSQQQGARMCSAAQCYVEQEEEVDVRYAAAVYNTTTHS